MKIKIILWILAGIMLSPLLFLLTIIISSIPIDLIIKNNEEVGIKI